MPNPIDITNKKFGRLLAQYPTKERQNNWVMWSCLCDCGVTKLVAGALLKNGNTKSCGCLMKEQNAKFCSSNFTKHGLSGSKSYISYHQYLRRTRLKSAGFNYMNEIDLQDILNYYGNCCIYCGGNYEHLDHIIPIAKGGKHDKNNLAPSCASCNFSKNSRILWEEWTPKNSIVSNYINA